MIRQPYLLALKNILHFWDTRFYHPADIISLQRILTDIFWDGREERRANLRLWFIRLLSLFLILLILKVILLLLYWVEPRAATLERTTHTWTLSIILWHTLTHSISKMKLFFKVHWCMYRHHFSLKLFVRHNAILKKKKKSCLIQSACFH